MEALKPCRDQIGDMSVHPAAAAQSILDRYSDRDLMPVNLEKIAADLGARIAPLPSTLPPDLRNLSGMYKRDHDGVPTLFYNSADSAVRRRFTIAHELGHHVLDHGDSFRDAAANFSASVFDHKEAAANRFAADLLMPAEIVQFMIEHEGVSSIQELASSFKVSEVAMSYRLKNLRLIA